jgi:hypothetical protein
VAEPSRLPPVDPERRSRLLAVKLAALVRDHTGAAGGEPLPFPDGAALLRPEGTWILAEARPERAVAAALALAETRGAEPVHVVIDGDAGDASRHATWFRDPPTVWSADGRTLHRAWPVSLPTPAPVDPDLADLRPLIVEAGADPVEEHGVLAGEVLGLEVCRAVRDSVSGRPRLEVGVGAHDREAFQLLHGDVPTVDALTGVVQRVAAVRADPDAHHPLRRLAAERLLRWRLTRDPSLVGLATLAPAPPPVPRRNLKDPTPCVAVGEDADGRRVVAAVTAGIDVAVVPYAADALATHEHDEGVRLLIILPVRDVHPAVERLAARLATPAEVVAVPAE